MEKERLEKIRRIIVLENELWFFNHHRAARADVQADWISVRAEDEWELTRLYLELYPEPPKDLLEDVKERQEKMRSAKLSLHEGVKRPLTLKQRIGLFFRKGSS